MSRFTIGAARKAAFASGLIDTVIIGNAYASDAELKALAAIDRYKLTFGVSVEAEASEIERRILAETNHFRRGDSNALVARSTQSRVKYRPIENLPHTNQEPFAYGDIVIGNDTFGQYKNELQIVLTPHQDARKTKSALFPRGVAFVGIFETMDQICFRIVGLNR